MTYRETPLLRLGDISSGYHQPDPMFRSHKLIKVTCVYKYKPVDL